MNRIDNSKFLLYIEPRKENKSLLPLDDEITNIMTYAFSKSQSGGANYSYTNQIEKFSKGNGWRGCHMTDCGQRSSNHDYLLENGMITNSLCSFYLRWYRDSIPKSEMDKIYELINFYKTK